MVCDNLEANRTDDTAYMPKIALGLVWSAPHYIFLQAFERALQGIPRECKRKVSQYWRHRQHGKEQGACCNCYNAGPLEYRLDIRF